MSPELRALSIRAVDCLRLIYKFHERGERVMTSTMRERLQVLESTGQLSEAAEQARAAARNARESLRWNPRARVERAVPRPDGVVLDSLEELTARTRAVARVLMEAAREDEPLGLPASFGESYAAMLQMLAGPVRQLADLRSPPPDRDELAGASGCQDHLERQAAQFAGMQEGNAARHLAGLSRQLVSELVRKSGDRN